MSRLLENEFDDILLDFKKEIKAKTEDNPSFSIVGSPLKESSYLLVGNNWGGDTTTPQQKEMPLVNDILLDPKNHTYKGYINFYTGLFDGDKGKTIEFLNQAVYTNGNWLRTPNESAKYESTLTTFNEISIPYVRRLIDLVSPNIIICFGNSERSATQGVFEAIGLDRIFWKVDSIKRSETNNGWSTYFYQYKGFSIYSFPHASKLSVWNTNIGENDNYKSLKNQLMHLID